MKSKISTLNGVTIDTMNTQTAPKQSASTKPKGEQPDIRLVVEELARQAHKMNALNAAMEYTDDEVWREKLFKEFGEVSFLVAALDLAKHEMEAQPDFAQKNPEREYSNVHEQKRDS